METQPVPETGEVEKSPIYGVRDSIIEGAKSLFTQSGQFLSALMSPTKLATQTSQETDENVVEKEKGNFTPGSEDKYLSGTVGKKNTWECTQCTFQNVAESNACDVCEMPRPPPKTPPEFLYISGYAGA